MKITGKAPEWVKTSLAKMAKISLSPSCYKNVKIKVKWKNNESADGDYGSCDWKDEDATAILILNSDISPLAAYSTMAHELHHVQQFYDYKLISLRNDRWIWEGKTYKSVAGSRRNFYTPWEVEARIAEKTNLKKYIKKHSEDR